MADKTMKELLEYYDMQDVENIDVIGEYEKVTKMALAWLDFCQNQLTKIDKLQTETVTGSKQLDQRVHMFERGLKQAHTILNEIAKLGLEERRVRVKEAQAQSLAQAWKQATGKYLDTLKGRHPELRAELAADEKQTLPELARKHIETLSQ